MVVLSSCESPEKSLDYKYIQSQLHWIAQEWPYWVRAKVFPVQSPVSHSD